MANPSTLVTVSYDSLDHEDASTMARNTRSAPKAFTRL